MSSTAVHPTPAKAVARPIDPITWGDAPQQTATAINLIVAHLVEHDPDAHVLADGETVTLPQLLGVATMACVGAGPAAMTVFVSSKQIRDDLARILNAPVLEHVGGAVAGPGGMKLLIRAAEPLPKPRFGIGARRA